MLTLSSILSTRYPFERIRTRMALKIKQKAGIMILMRAAARQCAIAIKGPVPNSVPGLLAGLREVVGNCPAFDPHANQFVGVRLGSPRSAAGAHGPGQRPRSQDEGISRGRPRGGQNPIRHDIGRDDGRLASLLAT